MQNILASNNQANNRLQTRGRKMSHISGNGIARLLRHGTVIRLGSRT